MTALEALAHIIPQRGPGLTLAEIESALVERGVVLQPGRLQQVLAYLVYPKMVTLDKEGRYLQTARIDL